MNKKGWIFTGIITTVIAFLLTTSFYIDLQNKRLDSQEETTIYNTAKYNYQV